MKRYKIATILIFIHGFVEICVGLGFIPLRLSDFDTSAMGQYFGYDLRKCPVSWCSRIVEE